MNFTFLRKSVHLHAHMFPFLFRLIFAILLFPFRLLKFICYRLLLLLRRKTTVLQFTLPDKFTLFESTGWLSKFIGPEKQGFSFFTFLLLLRKIRKSKRINTLIIEIPASFESTLNWSQIFDITAELDRVRQSGKKIIAHSSGGGLKTLMVLSRADLRYVGPGVSFMTALPHSESFFYAKLFENIGLKMEVYHAGKFKSAGESFSRANSSPAARENTTTLLSQIRHLILNRFATTPSLDTASLKRFTKLLHSQSISTGDDLMKCVFVNGIVEKPKVIQKLVIGNTDDSVVFHSFDRINRKKTNDKPDDTATEVVEIEKFKQKTENIFQFVKLEKRQDYRPFRIKKSASVAIATLHGTIVNGQSGDLPRSGSIVADPWQHIFQELQNGPDDAIILYIDSPGGLSDASEALYQSIRQLSRIKPVFAYFSGVAASGGYYLSCAANRIYSSPIAITGSIGVIRFRPEASSLLKKLNIHSERLLFDDTTDLLSLTSKPSRASRKLLEQSTVATYTDFLKRVSEGRNLSVDQVLSLAEGRVYVADELKGSGLIDQTTDLISLIEMYRDEAGIQDDRIQIRFLPDIQFNLRALIRTSLSLGQSQHYVSLTEVISRLSRLPFEITKAAASGQPMLLNMSLFKHQDKNEPQ